MTNSIRRDLVMMMISWTYVRHLEVKTMMKRRNDLAFRQEMRFRNKLVEYLTDWCMGNSHQIAPPAAGDVTAITRDLDEACMHAVAALLQGLPLQSEESDRGDLMEAKSQLFLKYFTLFMNLLNDCGESSQVYYVTLDTSQLCSYYPSQLPITNSLVMFTWSCQHNILRLSDISLTNFHFV